MRPRPYGCSPLAPCPPSPGPRSNGPTPGSYAAQYPVPMLGVLGSSVNMGTRTPTVLPWHRLGTWLLKPIRDASMFREPTPLSAFATTREDVGYLLENWGPPRESPRLTFCEIHRPVSLLDGGVELAPLAGQLVHRAPQGSYLDGGQDTDLRPPVARKPVGCRAHEGIEGPVTQRQGVAACQGVRERRLAI